MTFRTSGIFFSLIRTVNRALGLCVWSHVLYIQSPRFNPSTMETREGEAGRHVELPCGLRSTGEAVVRESAVTDLHWRK